MFTANSKPMPSSTATSLIAGVLAIVLLALWLVPPASANSQQLTIGRDDRQLVSSGDWARETTLNDMQALGFDVVQVLVNWDQYAPNPTSRRKPRFNDKNAASYGTPKWGELDAAIRGIVARGMTPMLNPAGPAPKWASTRKKSRFYGRHPKLSLYSNFVKAIARRYNGSGNLPRVTWWGAWNEPNLGGWLQPQWRYSKALGKRIPRSPHLYRSIYKRTVSQVRRAGIKSAKFLVGDTGPLGSKRKTARSPVYPKTWWREFFCLDEKSRTLKGVHRRARGCPAKFKKLKAIGVAHHPYARGGAKTPYLKGPSKLDLPLAQTNGLVAILNRAGSARRIRKKAPIYFTEYGLQTMPPDKYLAVTLGEQASWINVAEYLGYKNSRVRSYSQYPFVDDPLDPTSAKGFGGFQSGLRFNDFRAKPSFSSFRLPIFVTKRFKAGTYKNKVLVWGSVRPKVRPATVQIQSKTGSSFRTRATVTLRSSTRYFRKTVRLTGASSKKWRLRWVDPSGVEYFSRTARASKKR